MERFSQFFHPGIFILAVSLAPSTSNAIDFQVNTTADELNFVSCSPDKPKNCSLRSAIIWSNQIVGVDTITIKAGTFPITRVGKEPKINPETFNDFNIRDSVVIRGSGKDATIIDGMGKHRIFKIDDIPGVSQTVVIENLTLWRGNIPVGLQDGGGGAINAFPFTFDQREDSDSLTLRNIRATQNTVLEPLSSAAALAFSGEFLLIDDSQFDQNAAIAKNGTGQATSLINVTQESGANFTMRGTRIHDNQGPNNGDGTLVRVASFTNVFWDGNEISDNHDAIQLNISGHTGSAVIANTTFSGNSGSAIANTTNLGLLHVTISDNSTSLAADPVVRNSGVGNLWMKNTIISNPLATQNCHSDVLQQMTSLGNNISGDSTCFLEDPTDHPSTEPQLGILKFNGGKSRTHMPSASSIAVDHAETLPEVTKDQRGQARPSGKASDIGAVERGAILSGG